LKATVTDSYDPQHSVTTNLGFPVTVLDSDIHSCYTVPGLADNEAFFKDANEAEATPHTEANPIPEVFALNQNYPNPFRTSTEISFNLPRSTHVVLKVYNTLGQVVRVLVDGRMEAGRYSIPFQVQDLPTGTYYTTIV